MIFMPFSPRWLYVSPSRTSALLEETRTRKSSWFLQFAPIHVLNVQHTMAVKRKHSKVLCKLRNLPPGHELIDLEFLEIKAQSVFDKRNSSRRNGLASLNLTAWNTLKLQFVAIGSLFSSRGMFRRVIVATITMVFQQFTGINAGKTIPSNL